MLKKKAFIFPGQGAQKPFMGRSFYEKFLVSKEVYQEAEDILSMNITAKIFNHDEDALRQTDFCQVALFVTSIAILKALEVEIPEIFPQVTAGLSLGEYAALVAAKKATYQELLPIIKKRGAYMAKASSLCPQGMMAVIDLEEDRIPKRYQIANINAPNQIIISGSEAQMRAAKVELKDLGAKRVIPLKVSGAFHSSFMDSARKKLQPFIEGCKISPSSIDLVMNVTGKIEGESILIKRNLIRQVSGTTRWLECIRKMEEFDVDYVEIGPTQLVGINKKIITANASINIEEVKDIEKLYEKI